LPRPFNVTTNGRSSVWIHNMIGVMTSAMRSADWRASDFGIISPTTTWK
jgi:hypothetical protein